MQISRVVTSGNENSGGIKLYLVDVSISSSRDVAVGNKKFLGACGGCHEGCKDKTGDRFIPDRSAMDMDIAYYLLTEPKKDQENDVMVSPAKEAYQRLLAEKLLGNRTRILAFRNKPPEPEGMLQQILVETQTFSQTKPTKQRRKIPKFAERTLDAPGVVDDYYLSVLDWGSKNVVSIALGNTLYLWNSSDSSTSELVTVDDDDGPITSVSWSCEGQHIAVGLNSSDIQLWDTSSNRKLRTLQGVHESRVGSLAWNSSILTTGGMDGKIVNNDVRMRSHMVQTYRGHASEVCGQDLVSNWQVEEMITWYTYGMHQWHLLLHLWVITDGFIGLVTTWLQ